MTMRGGTTRHSAEHTARGEDGFTIIETSLALGIIFTVLLGLLGSLNSGVRGLVTGRQRTGATAVAKQVGEQAWASAYDDIGHALGTDATLAGDTALTGVAPDYLYTPQGGTAEPLVGAANPIYPAHQWDLARDGTDYTVKVYVTLVDRTAGDDSKRLTVAVSWTGAQYAAGIEPVVRLSTLVSRTAVVSSPDASGVVDVDGGVVTVTGTLAGLNLSRADVFFPYVHGDAGTDGVTTAHGFAGSSRSRLALLSGTAGGCGITGLVAECTGVKAETLADDDGGTVAPVRHSVGPLSDVGGTVSVGSLLQLVVGGTNNVTSKSGAQSCSTCSPAVGDGDGLFYATDEAAGPASAQIGFLGGLLSGNLMQIDAAGAATATVDADPVTPDHLVSSTGRLQIPGVRLVTLGALAPLGFSAGVTIAAVDVTATAAAGPTAAAPAVTGGPVPVQMCDNGFLGTLTTRTVTVTPGNNLSETESCSFAISGLLGALANVSLTTTVQAQSASKARTPSTGTITHGEAYLTNWLTVTTRLVSTELGITTIDLTVEVDYGRIAASADHPGA